MDDGIAAEAFDGMFDGIFYEMFQAHQLVEVQSIRSASVYPNGDYYIRLATIMTTIMRYQISAGGRRATEIDVGIAISTGARCWLGCMAVVTML